MTTETVVPDAVDSPQFRFKSSPMQPSRGIPIYYLDVNGEWTLNGLPLLVTDVDAVLLKIVNLLEVIVGEEWFEPTWGSDITLDLWEPKTNAFAASLEMDTIRAVNTFMRQEVTINPNSCQVVSDPNTDECSIVMSLYINKTSAVKILRVDLNKDSGFTYHLPGEL